MEPVDRETIVEILSKSFDDNKSVRYLTGNGSHYPQRIRALVRYCLHQAEAFGKVYLTGDKKACALVVFPHKRKTNLSTILWDIDLIFSCIGLAHIGRAMKREAKIKKLHPERPFYYLWYIGVLPNDQNRGIGTRLLKQIISDARAENCAVYLETSTERNLPWYQKYGFKIFSDPLVFSYKLYPLKLNE